MSLISRDNKYCGGKPRIAGTRITVSIIKGWYLGGNSIKQIQTYYPQLTIEKITAAVNYCSRNKI